MRQLIFLCVIGGIAFAAYQWSQKQSQPRVVAPNTQRDNAAAVVEHITAVGEQDVASPVSKASPGSPQASVPSPAIGEHPVASKFRQADVRQRIGLLNTLKSDASPGALDVLLTASADEHADVRRRAMRLLADRKEPEALERLRGAARSEDAADREAAFIALSAMDRHQVSESLVLRGVNDPKPEVRAAASHAAGQLYVWRAMPLLVANLNHADRSVRTVSIKSVNRLCGVQFQYDPTTDAVGRRSQVQNIQKKWQSYEVYHKDFMRRLQQRGE